MSDPSIELQGAIVMALKGASAVTAIVGQNVFDAVPESNPFPRLTIGAVQILPARAHDYDGADIIMTIESWSRAVGFPEVKNLGKAVASTLTDAALSISGYRIVDLIPEQTQYLRDPDGLTSHGVHVFRARTEPT